MPSAIRPHLPPHKDDAGWAHAAVGGQLPVLTWGKLYREVELLKSALRLYTKPLFAWRKALTRSTDGKTLYDFARSGLRNIGAIHRALDRRQFEFRPALALHRNFNGKTRTLFVYPWEERLVQLLLYRLLNRSLDGVMSSSSYAYRMNGYGVDRCQRRIARLLREPGQTRFVLKRDIKDFFSSIDHDTMLQIVRRYVPSDDYLFELIEGCVRFSYLEASAEQTATRGVPFGTPIACVLANLYLLDLDRALEAVPHAHFFRYADDLLVLANRRDTIEHAESEFDLAMRRLRLSSKPSHSAKFKLASATLCKQADIPVQSSFRHLGLKFSANGSIGLSKDKFRKIRNLFRFAFRRQRARIDRAADPTRRAAMLIRIARDRLETGLRNVAIIDYYLKHVTDEHQLKQLDRWLAEEVLSISFGGGHKKGYFRRLPFARLREMGLPSLVHRRRLIIHGHIESPFFQWKLQQEAHKSGGPVARPGRKVRPSLDAQKHRDVECS